MLHIPLDIGGRAFGAHIVPRPLYLCLPHSLVPGKADQVPGERGASLGHRKGLMSLEALGMVETRGLVCLLYTSPSPRDATLSRMPSSA